MACKQPFLHALVLYTLTGVATAARRGGGGDVTINLPLDLPPLPAAMFALRIILLVLLLAPISNTMKTLKAQLWSPPMYTLSAAILFMVLAQSLEVALIAVDYSSSIYTIGPPKGLVYASAFFYGFLEIPMSIVIMHFIISRQKVLCSQYGVTDSCALKQRVLVTVMLAGILIFDLAGTGFASTVRSTVATYRQNLSISTALYDTSLTFYLVLTFGIIASMYRLWNSFRMNASPHGDKAASVLFTLVAPLLTVRMIWRIVATCIRRQGIDPIVLSIVGIILLDYAYYAVLYLLSSLSLPAQPQQVAEGDKLVRD